MKILVCDDQEAFCEMLNADLTAAGHEVVLANDGWEGLVELGNSKFDAAIIDIDMPVINGLDLVRLVSNSTSNIAKETKLIICTSYDTEWSKAIAWANKVVETIPKPYKLSKLTEILGR